MRTSKYFSGNIILVYAVIIVLSFLCQIFEFIAPVNIMYIISLLLVLCSYLISGGFNVITYTIIFLVGLASLKDGLLSDMDYYTHVLITLCIFICIEVGPNIRINHKTFKIIANMFLVTALILLAAYYFGPLKSTHFGLQNAICLNMVNPNAAGLWVACIFIVLLYSSFLFKKLKRMLFLSVSVGLLPIILATQSRNSYFACILFVTGLIFTKIFKIKKVPNWILAILAALPLIVFWFYMFVIVENMGFWQNLFSLESINKDLGTRVDIWQKVINNFDNCFWLGDYHKYYNSQQHNSLLTIFCRFGGAVTVLACVSIYRSLKNLQDNSSFYAALSLSAVYFTGCFEASVFVGIAGMYLMLLLIPACASAEKVEEKSKNNEKLQVPKIEKGVYEKNKT